MCGQSQPQVTPLWGEYAVDLPILISGGTIVDGSGDEPYVGDVLILAGRIVEVGVVLRPENVLELDAHGLVVAPGFIDIHSHSDFSLYNDPRAVSSLTQGVTLEVVGNCGHGCAPITVPDIFQHNIYGYEPGMEMPWQSVGTYLDALQARRPAVNVVALVPNGNLRLSVVGRADRPAESGEILQMRKLLEQGMEEGAWGFSTGLEYDNERWSSEIEMIELCKVAAHAGGFYATHTRNQQGEAFEAIEEAIRTSGAGNIPLQISHISSVSRLGDDRAAAVRQAIAQVDRAREHQIDVSFDMHTRSFGMTNLSNALPGWAFEGSHKAIVARLKQRAQRDNMRRHHGIVHSLAAAGWHKMVLFNCLASPELSRRSIAEISTDWQMDPLDVICEVLLKEEANLHTVLVLGYVYTAEDTHFAFDHPGCMVGSDATTLALDKPLRGSLIHGAFTWAAWFYRHFVCETKQLTKQEAVRRLTSLPADRLNLTNRGRLRKNAWGDVAIFDPLSFAERGTDFEPGKIATGMVHVLVNGKLALRDGQLTGDQGGLVLRKN